MKLLLDAGLWLRYKDYSIVLEILGLALSKHYFVYLVYIKHQKSLSFIKKP
jgi:hypothetical protein